MGDLRDARGVDLDHRLLRRHAMVRLTHDHAVHAHSARRHEAFAFGAGAVAELGERSGEADGAARGHEEQYPQRPYRRHCLAGILQSTAPVNRARARGNRRARSE